eukprot:749145-Hanusia_phi.AAC.4
MSSTLKFGKIPTRFHEIQPDCNLLSADTSFAAPHLQMPLSLEGWGTDEIGGVEEARNLFNQTSGPGAAASPATRLLPGTARGTGDGPGVMRRVSAAGCSERRGLLRGGRMALGWDGRAAFSAELGLSIAVSFCSSVVAET